MTTEDEFQAALDLDPENNTLRLVFADWLQERDDPRAAGYRALGRLARHAGKYGGHPSYWAFWSSSDDKARVLPQDWWNEWRAVICEELEIDPETKSWSLPYNTLPFRKNSRRGAEDCAALAFSRLTPERQVELLRPSATPASSPAPA